MSGAADHRVKVARRIIAVLAVIALVALAMIYGPRIASGNYHRAAIERLASNALGRPVRIAGAIELSLLPEPQLRAKAITIGGPAGGRITADTLKLDLAPVPLLLGRLRATRLTLRKPDVTLPWPLPGGASAVAPPLWLASLHATIVDGVFHLGALTFNNANLSIFTGGPNAVLAASGTLDVAGRAAAVMLDINNTGANAPAPVRGSISLADHTGQLAFKGTLDRASVLRGALTGRLGAMAQTGAMQGDAQLIADGAAIALRDIDLRVDNPKRGDSSQTTGSATIALDPAPLLRLDLTGARWQIDTGFGLLNRLTMALPVAARLALTDARFGPIGLKSARANLIATASGLSVESASVALPGTATVSLHQTSAQRDTLAITAPDPATTLTALRARYPWLPAWPDGVGGLTLSGRMAIGNDGQVRLDGLNGTLGRAPLPQSRFTGAVIVRPFTHHATIAAQFAFDQLTLDPAAFAGLQRAVLAPNGTIAGPVVLSAQRLTIQHGKAKPLISFTHALFDGSLRDAASGGGIAVGLGTVRLGKAVLIGHGARQHDGGIIDARWTITGPDAAATLAAIDHAFGVDHAPWAALALWHHRFAASFAASGPMQAVHAGLTLHIGDIRAAALPVIDLATETATGPVSLHAPNAVSMIEQLGGKRTLGARNGLDWPGPGSVSLRASAFAAPGRVGLPNFVLSLGGLTTTGALSLRGGAHPALSGSLAVDTLPILPASALLHHALAMLGTNISLSLPSITAARVVQNHDTVATNAAGSITMTHGALNLGIIRADIAGGVFNGRLGLIAGDMPAISLKATLRRADAIILARTFGVNVTMNSGTVELATDLAAQGDTMAALDGTLAGGITAQGRFMSLNGIDLANAAAALTRAISARHHQGTVAALRAALTGGTTLFDTAAAQASLHGGIITLDKASLTGSAGAISLAGTLDTTKGTVALKAVVQPDMGGIAPPDVALGITGTPNQPHTVPQLSAVRGWITAHKTKMHRIGPPS